MGPRPKGHGRTAMILVIWVHSPTKRLEMGHRLLLQQALTPVVPSAFYLDKESQLALALGQTILGQMSRLDEALLKSISLRRRLMCRG
jgi:hypothetical protein